MRVWKVQDPFNRAAIFDYHPDGTLKKIADPVGISSEFTYSSERAITALSTPYGTTLFSQGDHDTQWIEAKDPWGAVERVEFHSVRSDMAAVDPSAPVEFAGANAALNLNNTFYWDKKAMGSMPKDANNVTILDYSKAHVIHWLKSPDGKLVSGIKHSEKRPLEGRVWYAYDDQPPTESGRPLGQSENRRPDGGLVWRRLRTDLPL